MGTLPPTDCDHCDRIDPERARRIINAVLTNIEGWRDRAMEIADHAIPANKVRALSLARDLEIARVALRRLAGLGDEDDAGKG